MTSNMKYKLLRPSTSTVVLRREIDPVNELQVARRGLPTAIELITAAAQTDAADFEKLERMQQSAARATTVKITPGYERQYLAAPGSRWASAELLYMVRCPFKLQQTVLSGCSSRVSSVCLCVVWNRIRKRRPKQFSDRDYESRGPGCTARVVLLLVAALGWCGAVMYSTIVSSSRQLCWQAVRYSSMRGAAKHR